MTNPNPRLRPAGWCFVGAVLWWAGLAAQAQDRLKQMPGYERYQKQSKEMTEAVKLGSLSVTWKDEGQACEYRRDGKRYRFDLATRQTIELTNAPSSAKGKTGLAKEPIRPKIHDDDDRPERGRQYRTAYSPDGKHKAFFREHNLWLAPADSTNGSPVTTEGNATARLKCGAASWVYGEELEQRTAIWWSPDSRLLAFYRFDESQVPDFFLQLDQTKVLSTVDREPYAKAGGSNPVVDLLIYDLAAKQTVTVDVRDGQPFENAVLGHYVYGVSWTKDSRELLFHRTNRRQNIMELAAANPATGQCRVVVREEWLPSWTENLPKLKFFEDGRRFLWSSERTGWRNFYLYDLQDGLCRALTDHAFEVADVVRLDEASGWLYYTARDGDNPMKLQLHRVKLNGTGDERLSDPAFHHQIDFAPDGRHFIDVAQTHDQPPTTVLRDAGGRWVAELAKSDMTRFRQLGLRTVELLRFKAADGQTDLYGLLHFPSNFSPRKRYPLLVSVYAGPATTGARESFVMPSKLTEWGFLVASFDSRSASGRGKRFLDAIYCKLGIVEMDDQAAGVRALWPRRYVDRRRVGIFGTSYGGTSAATCLLRFPGVFQAACANSAVTDYRNYDTIYAERYLGTPQDNPAAYDAARVMTYATNLQGRLLLFYGTADNNVHPNNTMQLVEALQKAGKSFELQVGPDQGHTGVNQDRMLEFFIENLVLRPPEPAPRPQAPTAPVKRSRRSARTERRRFGKDRVAYSRLWAIHPFDPGDGCRNGHLEAATNELRRMSCRGANELASYADACEVRPGRDVADRVGLDVFGGSWPGGGCGASSCRIREQNVNSRLSVRAEILQPQCLESEGWLVSPAVFKTEHGRLPHIPLSGLKRTNFLSGTGYARGWLPPSSPLRPHFFAVSRQSKYQIGREANDPEQCD